MRKKALRVRHALPCQRHARLRVRRKRQLDPFLGSPLGDRVMWRTLDDSRIGRRAVATKRRGLRTDRDPDRDQTMSARA